MNDFFVNKFPFEVPDSIAVVGNSGNIIGTGYGEDIDNHEWVIRFNAASVDGYEEDVGEKTSFRCINYRMQQSGRGVKASEATRKVVENLITGEKVICKPSTPSARRNAMKFYGKENDLYFLNKNVNSLISKVSNSYGIPVNNPSLGYVMTILMMSCSSGVIDMYGFGFHMEEKNEDIHYFENVDSDISGSHNYISEKLMIGKLQSKGRVKLHL